MKGLMPSTMDIKQKYEPTQPCPELSARLLSKNGAFAVRNPRLKQKVEHQKEMITLLKEQLNESRSDKQFLQNEILHVQLEQTKSKLPLRTRIKRRLSNSNSQKSKL